jgi:hypothetical protein
MKLQITFALVLLASVTTERSARSDDWTSVVLRAVCHSYPAEFDDHRGTAVLDHTEPLFDFAALLSVSGVNVTPEAALAAQEAEQRARRAFSVAKVELPGHVSCDLQFVGSRQRYLDVVLLELSGIVVNPSDGMSGVFVRSSAGGRPGATWMWVELVHEGGRWKVKRIRVLPVNDG